MYRRFSSQNNLLTDGSRKIKKITKCRELSYLGKLVFLFLKKNKIKKLKNRVPLRKKIITKDLRYF